MTQYNVFAHCPDCKREVRLEDGGIFAYHDRKPPTRALCNNSKRPLVAETADADPLEHYHLVDGTVHTRTLGDCEWCAESEQQS